MNELTEGVYYMTEEGAQRFLGDKKYTGLPVYVTPRKKLTNDYKEYVEYETWTVDESHLMGRIVPEFVTTQEPSMDVEAAALNTWAAYKASWGLPFLDGDALTELEQVVRRGTKGPFRAKIVNTTTVAVEQDAPLGQKPWQVCLVTKQPDLAEFKLTDQCNLDRLLAVTPEVVRSLIQEVRMYRAREKHRLSFKSSPPPPPSTVVPEGLYFLTESGAARFVGSKSGLAGLPVLVTHSKIDGEVFRANIWTADGEERLGTADQSDVTTKSPGWGAVQAAQIAWVAELRRQSPKTFVTRTVEELVDTLRAPNAEWDQTVRGNHITQSSRLDHETGDDTIQVTSSKHTTGVCEVLTISVTVVTPTKK